MSAKNCDRKGCKDVFRAFLVKKAQFDGELEIPCIIPEGKIPNKVIAFSEAIRSRDYNQWVHFYEDDVKFERIWNNPEKYLPILKKYNGVISPDFSLYRDMPLVMQQWNTYRGKAIGSWLQNNGVSVIPNVRFSDERSLEFCCLGVATQSIIAIGSHGCVKSIREREMFNNGLQFVVAAIKPHTIVVYGKSPDYIFEKFKKEGIEIIQFDSSFANAHKGVST